MRDNEDPATQVSPMATRGDAGQNAEADRAPLCAVGGNLCDERLAGDSNPAVAGPPNDTPRTNEFFASCII